MLWYWIQRWCRSKRRELGLGLLAGLLLLLGVLLWPAPPRSGEAARTAPDQKLASWERSPLDHGPDAPSLLSVTPVGVLYLPSVQLGFGASPEPTATPLPTAATPPPCGEVVQNGDLEQGHLAWVEHSANNYDVVTTAWSYPYEGDWVAWFSGYTEPLPLDIITQTVHVPSAAQDEQTLSLYLYVESNDSATTAYDFLFLRFYNASGSPVSDPIRIADNTDAPLPWTQQEVNLTGFSHFIGQDIMLELRSTADCADITNFVVDVISLPIACGLEKATPAESPGIGVVPR